MNNTYTRGQIYYANFDPIVGSEQGGFRPALILQNNTGNHFSPTVIVAPISSKADAKARLPTHVFLEDVLELPSVILLEQIRTLDKRRLREYIGQLDAAVMQEVENKALVSLGICSTEKR